MRQLRALHHVYASVRHAPPPTVRTAVHAGPRLFDGDGFDSDTTDYSSRAQQRLWLAPCDSVRRASPPTALYRTDDCVWLPNNMFWVRRRCHTSPQATPPPPPFGAPTRRQDA